MFSIRIYSIWTILLTFVIKGTCGNIECLKHYAECKHMTHDVGSTDTECKFQQKVLQCKASLLDIGCNYQSAVVKQRLRCVSICNHHQQVVSEDCKPFDQTTMASLRTATTRILTVFTSANDDVTSTSSSTFHLNQSSQSIYRPIIKNGNKTQANHAHYSTTVPRSRGHTSRSFSVLIAIFVSWFVQ